MKFHERFDIQLPLEEARQRFINRALNDIFTGFVASRLENADRFHARRAVATATGKRFLSNRSDFDRYIDDFIDCMAAIEAVREYIVDNLPYGNRERELDAIVQKLLSRAEADLGVRWEHGRFHRSGAEVLDERVVNEPLRWLREAGVDSVLQPFEKSLRHLTEAAQRPELAADAVTDAYEALEALAKIVTGRPGRDLSANAQGFTSKLSVTDEHRRMLKEYISYGNHYRHAESGDAPRPSLSLPQAEFFVYLTGAFIRLAIEEGAIPPAA